MFLTKITLDTRCAEARRDLSDPYQLHSTLCRAFSSPERKCPGGEFLWRLEPEVNSQGLPTVLIQSRSLPNWEGIGLKGWLAGATPPVDLRTRLKLESISVGDRFRFRLRANPSVRRNGRRVGLAQLDAQQAWIRRVGELHGFTFPECRPFDFLDASPGKIDVQISQGQMLRGRQHAGNEIKVYSVLYDGRVQVADAAKFRSVLQAGIGHGKVMGLGLFSIVPIA